MYQVDLRDAEQASSLEQCGRPRHLESLWHLWSSFSNSFYIPYKMPFPEMMVETPLHLSLLPAKPLRAILEKIPLTIESRRPLSNDLVPAKL